MGGFKQFQIFFDSPVATFYGGQTVFGRLQVKLTEPKNMRGIELKFKGEAEVKWSETRHVRDSDGKSRTVHDHYRSHEIYFEDLHYVIGGPNSEMTLAAGDHVFPFQRTLPYNLPSSFEGKFGHIRYTLKATMNRPWKFNHESKAAFTVIAHLDLNHEYNVKNPVKMEQHKYLCCCCCKSGPITLVTHIPATGFVPGQDIPITIELDNNTTETINNVCCKLTKVVAFHATAPHRKTRTDRVEVAAVDFGRVEPNGSNTWSKKLSVPSLPPSYLKYCSIIDLGYQLRARATIAGPHKNLHTHDINVVLGTIPLLTYVPTTMPPGMLPGMPPLANHPDLPPSFNDAVGGKGSGSGVCWNTTPNAPMNQFAPSGSTVPSAPFLPEAMYPELPPPSYEECMLGPGNIYDENDNQHTQGEMGFTPRYPTYHLGAQQGCK